MKEIYNNNLQIKNIINIIYRLGANKEKFDIFISIYLNVLNLQAIFVNYLKLPDIFS